MLLIFVHIDAVARSGRLFMLFVLRYRLVALLVEALYVDGMSHI